MSGAQLLTKDFDAKGSVEKRYDAQSAPTTLLIQTKTLVGHYPQDWMKQTIKEALHL